MSTIFSNQSEQIAAILADEAQRGEAIQNFKESMVSILRQTARMEGQIENKYDAMVGIPSPLRRKQVFNALIDTSLHHLAVLDDPLIPHLMDAEFQASVAALQPRLNRIIVVADNAVTLYC